MKNYLNEIGKFPTPTQEHYLEYFKTKSDKVKNFIIEGNLQLVYQQGKKYQKYVDAETFEDVIFEGNLGLIKAVEKFNPNKGYKFSTYAAFWIASSMISFLKNNSKTADKTISLENEFTNLDEEEGSNFIDLIASEEPDTKELDNYYLAKNLTKLQNVLTTREYDVLCYSFGVDGYEELDLNEIASRLEYTPETIRSIREGALKKIRGVYSLNDF
jgi:RNA polymerase sigma factor (sigma-70 family)